MDTVNKKDSYFFEAVFTDEEKAPVTPSSGSWRIDSIGQDGTETEIKSDTSFSPTGSTYKFEVQPNENRIINTSNKIERRRATVTIIYGTNKQKSEEYFWQVKNLAKIT